MNLFRAQKNKTPLFLLGVIAFTTLMAFPADAFAQSRRSGSRSSRSFSSSRSKPTTSRSNSTAKPKKKSTNSWGSKKSTTSKPKKSAAQTKADRALYDRAKKNGTHYSSRSQATTAFKQAKGAEISAKYPTKFDAKPTSRPSYIPQSTSVGGNTYNISYNDRYGGYGYMDALGTFILYDMMTDAAFMDSQMRSYGYAYGPPPSRASAGFATFGIIVGVLVVLVIGVIVIKSA